MINSSEIIKQLENKKIGVLYGGMSSEREIAILSGKAVLKALKKMKLDVCGIDVDKNIIEKIKKEKIDIAYIALHGPFGEDGTIQGMLEILGIPYTGCNVFASSVCMEKNMAKSLFKLANIATPDWSVLKKFENLPDIKHYPVVVKPVSCGSALGITIVKNFEEFVKAAKKAFEYGQEIIIEQFIMGKEITVGVLDGKALPVIEIVPEGKFYDFKSKYQKGCSKHIIPAEISKKSYSTAQNYAEKIYKFFKCRAVCRVDMIVDKSDKVWVLENNTIPGMTETSLLPDAGSAAGYNFESLVLKIIESSIRNA
ncbi:MAG: D-alanine--D-alanine ligase [Endomicrobium sp.]|jgi:D-alanine-D-alanine ligase|uniref:D-alanine--D-alanine ligase n=1 Tax=Candidatus Endomicrobiellum cubanum TaxID=3242325 RepID=UPI00283961EE|nr:D-alanine--D-alanine ligase [Endomicrobium sp.]MDR2395893.1 D-alanine--D-alanine ligase [Endomicrobium sp.]